MASEGTFVLADIGGYTSFLTGVGIQHGKETIEHLLNRLIKSSDRKWKVANVMGDCVFFYADTPEPPDETFARVQTLFESFQDAQFDIAAGSTCRCGACDRTEQLSLKFVVHRGEYDVQNIGGRKELFGREIVVATRLLKNSVPAKEYVIATPAVAGLADAAGMPAQQGSDDLESIGRIEYAYIDLAPARLAYEKSRAFHVTGETSKLTVPHEIDAPADVVWDALLKLEKRAVWQVTISKMEHIQGQANAVGEVHSCVHGSGKMVHATIAVDTDSMQKTERVWITPGIMKDVYVTLQAIPLSDTRTRVELRAIFKPAVPLLSHAAWPVFIWKLKRDIDKDMRGLQEFCETGRVAGREPALVA